MAFVTIKDKDNATLGHLQTDAQERLGIHNLLHAVDRKGAGVAGGTFTSGAWRTRDLNTLVINSITGASLASNQITLPAGKYWIDASSPYFLTYTTVFARIYNVTASLMLLEGGPFNSTGSVSAWGHQVGKISGIIDLAVQSVLELQNISNATHVSFGFGYGDSIGQAYNYYADVKIWKLS